jgi:hypothetical protein
MITSIIIGLFVWALVATYFLWTSIRSGKKKIELKADIEKLMDEYPQEKKLDAYLSAHEQIEKITPWFQKSLSTIGVIAFFSMSAATLTQTISAQLNEFKAQSAELRINEIQSMAATTERANKQTLAAILSLIDSGSHVSKEMAELLGSRLHSLGEKNRSDSLTPQETREWIRVAMAIGNMNCAAQIWQSSSDSDLNQAGIGQPELLTFGELYYVLRDNKMSRKALSRFDFDENRSESAAIRAAALEVAISDQIGASTTLEQWSERIASQFSAEKKTVSDLISIGAGTLKKQRARVVINPAEDYCKSSATQA